MAKNFDTRPLSSALGTEIIGLDVSDRIVWMVDGRIDRIEDRANVRIDVGEVGA